MYIECNCLLNSLIALLLFFSKNQNTVTKNSKILLKYSHFMKPYKKYIIWSKDKEEMKEKQFLNSIMIQQ